MERTFQSHSETTHIEPVDPVICYPEAAYKIVHLQLCMTVLIEIFLGSIIVVHMLIITQVLQREPEINDFDLHEGRHS